MRNVLRIAMMVCLAVAALGGVACQQAPEPAPEAQAPPPPSDEDLLHALAADFSSTWGKGDAAELSGYWTESGDTVTADGHFAGRAAIQEYYTQGFSGPFAGTQLDVKTTRVRFLQPDLALASGTYAVTGAKGPDGEDLPAMNGLWTNVNLKVGDQWLIASSRPMIPIEPPAADAGS